MRVVVVGGGAGGASFAARMRRLDEKAQITILEKTAETSIASCGLPYFIGDVIESRDEMQVATPAFMKKLFNIPRFNATACVPLFKPIPDSVYSSIFRAPTLHIYSILTKQILYSRAVVVYPHREPFSNFKFSFFCYLHYFILSSLSNCLSRCVCFYYRIADLPYCLHLIAFQFLPILCEFVFYLVAKSLEMLSAATYFQLFGLHINSPVG